MKKYFFSFLTVVCFTAVGISATNNRINFKRSTPEILKDTVPSTQNGNADTAGGTLDATGNTGISGISGTSTDTTGNTRGSKKYNHSKGSNKKNNSGNKDSSSTMPPR